MIRLLSAILISICTHCATLKNDSFYLFSNQTLDVLNINTITDEVLVENSIKCAAACVIRADCEAFSFAHTESKCVRIMFSSNILFPLVFGVDDTLPEADIFTRSNAHAWIIRDDYTYNSTLKFWYRVVMGPKANATDASDACKADGAYLILIRHQADYDFVINLQDQLGVNPVMYLQGTRQTKYDDFVDDLGRPLPFCQWDVDGTSGGGLYLRTNVDRVMETSGGGGTLRYICQVLLN